jgi:methionyl-tRNA formyltransferase
MDEGDILIQESWKVNEDDTTGILFQKTSERAGPLLVETLKCLQNGTIKPKKQNSTQATYTKMIEKTDAAVHVDWTINQAYHAWQAYTPWPGLYTFF